MLDGVFSGYYRLAHSIARSQTISLADTDFLGIQCEFPVNVKRISFHIVTNAHNYIVYMETTLGSTVVTTLSYGVNHHTELITAVQETLPTWPSGNGTLPSSTNDSIYGYDEEYYLSNTTTSAWTHSSSEEPQTPPGLPPITIYMILKAILCIAVLVATFFGNVLIIYAYATTKKLRTYTNQFIIGLAVADLVSGGITPGLLNIPWIIGYWPFSELLCLGALYINHIFIHATFLMTMIICFDRFWALNMPLNHLKGKTTKRAHWMMSVSYILPIFIWTPLVIIFPYIGLTVRIRPPVCVPSYGYHPNYTFICSAGHVMDSDYCYANPVCLRL